MAYARKGLNSDVYLVNTIRGYICYCCQLNDTKYTDSVMLNLEDVKSHLDKHMEAGHKVEQHTIERVNRELNEENNTNLSNIVFGAIVT